MDETLFQKVNTIQGLALLINMKTEYCVFIQYSGHISGLEISIRASKEHYGEHVADSQVYINEKHYSGKHELYTRLDRIIETLEQFLLDKGIPYEYLRKIERIEYNYRF